MGNHARHDIGLKKNETNSEEIWQLFECPCHCHYEGTDFQVEIDVHCISEQMFMLVRSISASGKICHNLQESINPLDWITEMFLCWHWETVSSKGKRVRCEEWFVWKCHETVSETYWLYVSHQTVSVLVLYWCKIRKAFREAVPHACTLSRVGGCNLTISTVSRVWSWLQIHRPQSTRVNMQSWQE